VRCGHGKPAHTAGVHLCAVGHVARPAGREA
jgi:hypothetical protein